MIATSGYAQVYPIPAPIASTGHDFTTCGCCTCADKRHAAGMTERRPPFIGVEESARLNAAYTARFRERYT